MLEMKKFFNTIDGINELFGKIAGWSSILLVLLVCIDVVLRYFFQWSRVWMMELELYLFAITFLLGGAYAFQKDQHVRVDVFYTNMSGKNKARVNIIGGVLLLLPWCIIILYITQRYFLKSWSIGESSGQPGGLPMLYIKKGLLVIGFFLLFLQGLSSIYKSSKKLKS
jgi:TRAP-type mannitol/chloroaromatic compound transport system permease small subunit